MTAPLLACVQAKSTTYNKQTSSEAPLDGSGANCAAPAGGDGNNAPTAVAAAAHGAAPAGGDRADSPAAVTAASCIKDSNTCKAPAEVSAHPINKHPKP